MFRLPAMSSRRGLLTGGLASLLPFTVRAQSPSRARELLAPLLSRHRVPGASVALIRDGEIAELAAIGADPQTLFQAASISKVVRLSPCCAWSNKAASASTRR